MIDTILYVSRQSDTCSADDVRHILDAARRNNARLGLTGLLLHGTREFAQVLEGPRDAIDEMLLRLADDPRHRDIVTLARSEAPVRSFAGWTMASCELGVGLDCVGAGRHRIMDDMFGARPGETLAFMRGFYERMAPEVPA